MAWDPELPFTKEAQDGLTQGIGYLLAGLAGNTDGNEITGVTIQQTRVSGFRVILRAIQRDTEGGSVRVVGFTSGSDPSSALLYAESAYRENAIRWSPDRFAKSVSANGKKKNKRLNIGT